MASQQPGCAISPANYRVEEFQGALKTLDERAKTQTESTQRGAAKVMVENGDQCEDGWTLSVAGKESETHYGKTGGVSF